VSLRRKGGLLLVLFGALVLTMAGAAFAVDSFDDVPAGHDFHSEIMSLANAGIVEGFADATFRPDEFVKRMQMAKILVLATEMHTAATDNASNPTFPDCLPATGTPYPFDYVEEAASAGYFEGDDLGMFNPYANITRAQLALVIVRAGGDALEEPPADWDHGLTDLPDFAEAAIIKAKYNGILDGFPDGTFRPYENATRGHVAKMVDHMMDLAMMAKLGGALTGTAAAAGADFEAIAAHLNGVIGLGYNTIGTDAVAKMLFDDNSANDPFILDTREPADFADGHIPGAVNIPLQDLAMALLKEDPRIPMDRHIVVASYWGDDGDFAMVLLNALRITDPAAQATAAAAKEPLPYPIAQVLFQGMTSWSFDRELVPEDTRFEDAQAAGIVIKGELEAGAVSYPEAGPYPDFSAFDVTDPITQIVIRAHRYLNSVPNQTDLHIYPSQLQALLDDADPANDPQVVSVRSLAHFEAGHIPGAILVPWLQSANVEQYTKYLDPTAGMIAAYCYTGHTGGVATMAFGIMGYENARNVLYGMNGWNSAAPGSGQLLNFDQMRTWDFPLNDGDDGDLDSLAAYEPPSGCEGCHTELTGIFVDREVMDPPPAPAVAPSEGEG